MMTYETLLALTGFAFVTSATPGPNNLMLMASGANFGMRRTVPHMLGISVGHALMVFLVGLGLAGVFKAWPPALVALKVASVTASSRARKPDKTSRTWASATACAWPRAKCTKPTKAAALHKHTNRVGQ